MINNMKADSIFFLCFEQKVTLCFGQGKNCFSFLYL